MPALFIRFRDVICVLKNTVKMRYRMYLTLLISLRRPEYRRRSHGTHGSCGKKLNLTAY